MDYTFFEENYVWMIVIGVVALMTVIGYIADKKDFGKKEKQPKEKKSKKAKQTMEEFEVEDNAQETFDNDMANVEDFASPTEEQINVDLDADNFEFPMEGTTESVAPLENYESNDETLEQSEFNDSLNEAVEETEDMTTDLSFDTPIVDAFDTPVVEQEFEPVVEPTEELEEVEQQVEEPAVEAFEMPEQLNVEEDSTVETEELKSTETFEMPETTEENNDDFELPSIDKLNQEIADVEEDEDVWKF